MQLLSLTALSDLSGFAFRTVKKRLEGQIRPQQIGANGSHLYDSTEALRLLFAPMVACDGEALDPGQERARLDRLKADHQELINAKLEGALIDVDANRKFWTDCIIAWKTKLQGIPSKLAVFINDEDRNRCFTLAQKEIDDLLRDMASVNPGTDE